jgi:hypothetical protein
MGLAAAAEYDQRMEPDPQADLAMALVTRIRTDRTIRRVTDFARAEGLSVRLLQRLFSAYVGHPPPPIEREVFGARLPTGWRSGCLPDFSVPAMDY